MIVQPNFLDHWKTNALAAKIGRLEALTALLALWSHCQNQRTWIFPSNELMLAGICRYTGNPRVLVDTLLELNLLEKTPENTLEVHQWAETNAKLLHNWDAGKKGGRPPKQPKDEPTENPRVNPTRTQGEPKAEPIREEKRREENTPLIPQGGNLPALIASVSQTSATAAETPSPQHDKSEATASPKKRNGGRAHLTEPQFPANLPEAYIAPLTTWFHHKRLTGKGYVETGWAALVTRERTFTPAQVAASVQASMANGYTGLFTADLAAKTAAAPQKKEMGAAPVAQPIITPEWDWLELANTLWPNHNLHRQRWQDLPASTRHDLRQAHQKGLPA